jgi:hypothetical protein
MRFSNQTHVKDQDVTTAQDITFPRPHGERVQQSISMLYIDATRTILTAFRTLSRCTTEYKKTSLGLRCSVPMALCFQRLDKG